MLQVFTRHPLPWSRNSLGEVVDGNNMCVGNADYVLELVKILTPKQLRILGGHKPRKLYVVRKKNSNEDLNSKRVWKQKHWADRRCREGYEVVEVTLQPVQK